MNRLRTKPRCTGLSRLLLLALSVTLAGPARDGPPAPDDDVFFLPDDLEVTLWAESPLFNNPTNIDIDHRGRVWVTEAVNYRDFNNKDLPLRKAGDRVVILEDTDGDGKADTSSVFVQDPDLRAPLGIAVLGNRVVVSSSPSLIVYTDDDGDDRSDRKEVLLTGFGGYDHDHSLHALVAGPDGRWYFNTGNAGPHVVTDRAGWTLRSGSLYRGGSPYNLDNTPGLVSDDGRRWVGGLALRVEPDGTGLTVLGHNFRNAYELAVDSFGDLWQNDNDDEVMTCRTTWLMEGANTGYFSADGTRYWQADRRPGQDTFTAQWHQEDPGVLPAGDRTGAGSPTGILRYESDLLGPAYRGMLLSADAGRNVVYAYHPEARGAGYELERSRFITSVEESTEGYVWNDDAHLTDRRKWFRPSDAAVGPDGAVYVADWYDAFVGGHRAADNTVYGRIYRITPKGRALTTPRLDLATTDGQIQALLSPAVNVRNLGFTRLEAQGEAVLGVIRRLLDEDNPFHRARAVWLMSRLGTAGQAVVEGLLRHDDPSLRLVAFRALRHTHPDPLSLARRLADDPSTAVRREVALSLRDAPAAEIQGLFLDLAAGFDGRDPWYLEALGQAADGKEEALYPLLRDRFGAGDPAGWDGRMAGLAWRLHPQAAVGDLSRRAETAARSAGERKRALTALGFIDDPAAAEAMAALTRSSLPDVASQATWWLNYRKSNLWRAYPAAGMPPAGYPSDAEAWDRIRALQATVWNDSLFIERRVSAAMELAVEPLGGRMLLAMYGENEWRHTFRDNGAWQINAALRAALANNPDPTVHTFVLKKLPHTSPDPPPSAGAAAALPGDAERGEVRFALHCARCHKAGAAGADIGPDLSAVRTKFDRPGLLDAVVNPDDAVAHNYEAWLVTTHEGYATLGFLLSDGETVVIQDVAGRRESLTADAVKERRPLDVSLMPSASVMGLSDQDLADLAAYLFSLP